MPGNRGKTSLKTSHRNAHPMRDFDRLPKELRHWVSHAKLPWRSKTVQVKYDQALRKTGSPKAALAELDRIQDKLVSKDTRRLWGEAHPEAAN